MKLRMKEKATVYIVGGDQAARNGIARLIKDMELKPQTYPSAEEFLNSYSCAGTECLILDVRMTEMTGLQLLAKMSEQNRYVPTLFVTEHGDIPMAVEALKMGAVDIIEKPFRERLLWEKVKEALEISDNSNHIHFEHDNLMGKVSLLTDQDQQILKYLLTGKTDKQIANDMGFTRRTAAHHRTAILEKLQATSLVELAQSFVRFDACI